MVSWSWGCVVTWSWCRWVGSYSLVCDISDISTSGIINMIVDNLGTTIGKSNTVGSGCLVTITGFIGRKSSLAIIISNTVFKSIYWWGSWPIDVWGWGRGVLWSWVGNNWSWMGNLYNCWVSNYWVVDNGVVDWVMDKSMMSQWMMKSMWMSNQWGMYDGWSMMGLMDGMRDGGSMSMLDGSMATDISGGNSQKGGKCNKSLTNKKNLLYEKI